MAEPQDPGWKNHFKVLPSGGISSVNEQHCIKYSFLSHHEYTKCQLMYLAKNWLNIYDALSGQLSVEVLNLMMLHVRKHWQLTWSLHFLLLLPFQIVSMTDLHW